MKVHRRDLFKTAAAAGAATGSPGFSAQHPIAETSSEEIYRLLGFDTTPGEDPVKLWSWLRPTAQWLAGPLSPDGWAGQVFIADHADIFAFRFLFLSPAWIEGAPPGRRGDYCASHFDGWFKDWRGWWKTVGPKASDNSYARLVWQKQASITNDAEANGWVNPPYRKGWSL